LANLDCFGGKREIPAISEASLVSYIASRLIVDLGRKLSILRLPGEEKLWKCGKQMGREKV
jgi:hypothetical protein